MIFDEGDETIEKSGLRNPWRYQGKRVEEETDLVFFGKRYYNPEYGRWMTPDPLGFIDGPNLYCYAHNNPFKYKDLDGFSSEKEGIDSEFDQYFYGEVEPHCVCETHRKCKKGGTSGFAFSRSARFQGANRAFWGILEGGAGAGSIYGSGGLAAPIGWAMLVHGVDEFATGMYTLVTGEEAVSSTEVLLVNSGLTPETAIMVNDGISTLLSGGRAKVGKVAVGFEFTKKAKSHIWASGRGKTAVQNAYLHWKKHGKEFPGMVNSRQYVVKARELLTRVGHVEWKKKETSRLYSCPCCGYFTRSQSDFGSYEICPVCFWEDDLLQSEDVLLTGGSNEVSLAEAQENFKVYRASNKESIHLVRPPNMNEMPD